MTGVPKPTTKKAIIDPKTSTNPGENLTGSPDENSGKPEMNVLHYVIPAVVVVAAVLCGVLIFVLKRNKKNGNGRNRNVEENANSDKLLGGNRK